jgi:membrane protease YdiL (CAAX protease family)
VSWSSAAPRNPGLLERTVLDQQVEQSTARTGRWPLSVAVGPLAILAVLIAVDNVAARGAAEPHGATAGSLIISMAGELLLLALTVFFGRKAAQRAGGYGPAIGLSMTQRRDWLPWIIGIGIIVVGRLVIGALTAAFVSPDALKQSSNLQLNHVDATTTVLLLLLTVVIAPITEEMLFRGFMLRALMQRLRFWPAMLITTVVFAGAHAYEVDSAVGIVVLVSSIGLIGFANAYLVRITGRLAPAIMVHATSNLVAVCVVVARARS